MGRRRRLAYLLRERAVARDRRDFLVGVYEDAKKQWEAFTEDADPELRAFVLGVKGRVELLVERQDRVLEGLEAPISRALQREDALRRGHTEEEAGAIAGEDGT